MKLIESTKTTATLKLSRTEFDDLRMAIIMANYMLVVERDGVVQMTDRDREAGAVFKPKIRKLLRRWTLIEIENGWDEDDDYE